MNAIHICASIWSSKSQTSLELAGHLSSPLVMIFQHRAPGVPESIITVEDRVEEGIKCLCFVYISIRDVTKLVNQQAYVISDSHFAVYKKKSPFCSPQCWPAWTLSELWSHAFSPYSDKQLICALLPMSIYSPFPTQVLEEEPCSAKPAFCPACLTLDTGFAWSCS